MTQGAVRPSQRSAAIKVCVPQCPNGACARRRFPRFARPRSRVIFVVVAVSSMKTRRCGSCRIRARRWSCQTRRSRATSSRPASDASRVFFIRIAADNKKSRQRCRVGHNAAFGLQLGRQFRHRHVAIGLNPADQYIGVSRQFASTTRPALRRRLHRSRGLHPLGNANTRCCTDPKTTGCRSPRRPSFNVTVNPNPKIRR